MTYLMALAMGTMLCVTIFQLIPEALDLLHQKKYKILCEDYTTEHKYNIYTQNYTISTAVSDNECRNVCEANDPGNPEFCLIYIGGPTGKK